MYIIKNLCIHLSFCFFFGCVKYQDLFDKRSKRKEEWKQYHPKRRGAQRGKQHPPKEGRKKKKKDEQFFSPALPPHGFGHLPASINASAQELRTSVHQGDVVVLDHLKDLVLDLGTGHVQSLLCSAPNAPLNTSRLLFTT